MSHRPATPLAGIISITPVHSGLPACVLPVNPPVEEVDKALDYNEQSLLAGYNIGRRGNTRLQRISFTSFFPADLSQPYVNPDLPFTATPENWVRLFNQILKTKTICFVSIPGLALNKEMVLTEFRSGLEGGNGDATDIVYSMTWVEYRRIGITNDPRRAPARPVAAGTGGGGHYTIVAGDTLWAIAKRTYGDGSKWRLIWDANAPMTSGNPDLIYPGEVIYLPRA